VITGLKVKSFMDNRWTVLKNIIRSNGYRNGMFLSLIDKEGRIVSANASMIKTLHLGNPRSETYNILELLHPEHIDPFRQALNDSQANGRHSSAELYMKNGYFHPVRWNISYLGAVTG
jgi:PAS domain-containing protein